MSREKNRRVYKVVLTGGPCGGKTSGKSRLAVFFESYGFQVYRTPEVASILFSGGIKFQGLNKEQQLILQENLLLTLIRIEDTYVRLAESLDKPCLIIFDRGTLDGAAYTDPDVWQEILQRNNLNPVELRDVRYDQIVHLVSTAVDAKAYYSRDNNKDRTEEIPEAAELDRKTRDAWNGHPNVTVIENKPCRDFEEKILKLIKTVCRGAGIDYGDRLSHNSKERKFLVKQINEDRFPSYEEFDVVHNFLLDKEPNTQVRIRKRGQHNNWYYTRTTCRNINGRQVETRMQISRREYNALLSEHADPRCQSIHKKRRYFFHEQHYFQLDIFLPPMPQGFDKLLILETYTTSTADIHLPFMAIDREITDDNRYSLFTLSLNHNKRTLKNTNMAVDAESFVLLDDRPSLLILTPTSKKQKPTTDFDPPSLVEHGGWMHPNSPTYKPFAMEEIDERIKRPEIQRRTGRKQSNKRTNVENYDEYNSFRRISNNSEIYFPINGHFGNCCCCCCTHFLREFYHPLSFYSMTPAILEQPKRKNKKKIDD